MPTEIGEVPVIFLSCHHAYTAFGNLSAILRDFLSAVCRQMRKPIKGGLNIFLLHTYSGIFLGQFDSR